MPSRFQSFDDPSERAHGAARGEGVLDHAAAGAAGGAEHGERKAGGVGGHGARIYAPASYGRTRAAAAVRPASGPAPSYARPPPAARATAAIWSAAASSTAADSQYPVCDSGVHPVSAPPDATAWSASTASA